MRTGFYTHPDFLLHVTREGHPERPERLVAIELMLHQTGLWAQLQRPEFGPATEEQLWACHTRAHIERVRHLSEQGCGELDGDTVVGPASFEVARLASGAAIAATDAVLAGRLDNAFCAVRPPGHHAGSGRQQRWPWGFCLFNHVAVAARYAQSHCGVEKVAILDFDVHHGNGTQEIFEGDHSVLFVSLHEWGIFPGSGADQERGIGDGLGTTINFPIPSHSDGRVYRRAWEQVGVAVEKFGPELIIVSAGFDAHIGDPLAHMALLSVDFGYIVAQTKAWAEKLCDGHLVCVLEGGYNLGALSESVAGVIAVLLGDQDGAAVE